MDDRTLGARIAKRWPMLRVLFACGLAKAYLEQRALLSGGLLFIPKPYAPNELAEKVRLALNSEPQQGADRSSTRSHTGCVVPGPAPRGRMRRMQTHAVTLISGDGIGPEIADATRLVVEATGARIQWVPALAGGAALRHSGDPLPPETLDGLRKTKVCLRGPTRERRAQVGLRQALELFAQVRWVRSLAGVPARARDVDVVVIRETSQGFGRGLEHAIDRNTAESVAVLTREGCARFFAFAFEHARATGRRRVAIVHRQSGMRFTSELWLEVARESARAFPKLTFEELAADVAVERLVRDPSQFDVLATSNLFCDVLGDAAAGLVGGPGVVPAATFGVEAAIFEVTHGPALDVAGRGTGNPAALMFAAARLLEHLGHRAAAARLRNGVEAALRHKRARTPDLGGNGTLNTFTQQVLRELDKG